MDTFQEGEGGTNWESKHWKIYISICKIDSLWEFVVWCTELKPVLCDNLEGVQGKMEVQEAGREGTYVYVWVIHIEVWQKTTQHYKPIILQLKINKLNNNLMFK